MQSEESRETQLDLERWPRRATFEFYRGFDKPYFNVCTRLDLTALVALKDRLPGGLTLAYHHLALLVANRVEPFRYRVRGSGVRVFAQIGGSMTVLRSDDSIAFALLPFLPDHAAFVATTRPRVQAVQRGEVAFTPALDRGPANDALIHFTTLPWFDFTSFSHARNWQRDGDHDDSIPKIAFGRVVAEGGRQRMAMSVEVHHGLMDGLHVGRFVQGLQAALDDPAPHLGLAAG